jgi:single-strand DNA-binding protein
MSLHASAYGRLGQDPKTITTKAGKPMASASLACDVTPYGHDGDAVSVWVNVVAFGQVAEALQRHAKGDMLAVMGRLTKKAFVARDGTQRESWSLTA